MPANGSATDVGLTWVPSVLGLVLKVIWDTSSAQERSSESVSTETWPALAGAMGNCSASSVSLSVSLRLLRLLDLLPRDLLRDLPRDLRPRPRDPRDEFEADGVSSKRLPFMEAGDLGGSAGPAEGVDGVTTFTLDEEGAMVDMPLLLLQNPCCDRIEMVVAVDVEEETRFISTGRGDGTLAVLDVDG